MSKRVLVIAFAEDSITKIDQERAKEELSLLGLSAVFIPTTHNSAPSFNYYIGSEQEPS